MPDTLSATFGPYRIVQKIGEGGMGAVYLAEDTRLSRRVALKVPRFASDEDPRVIERFYREARMAAQVEHHTNLCPVYEVGQIDGTHYLTMAFIEGKPLTDYLREGQPWPQAQALAMIGQIAQALAQLHLRGIVHRDLKPGNVMVKSDGTAVLLDFGLARSFVSHSQQMTKEGQILGTPAYMAPEQILADEQQIGAATDVWALGILLYQMLAGTMPFGVARFEELAARMLYASTPQLPDPTLQHLIDASLAKKAADRPADGATFLRLLAKQNLPGGSPPLAAASHEASLQRTVSTDHNLTLTRPPTARRPLLLAGLALLGAAAVVTALLFALQGSPNATTEKLAKTTTSQPADHTASVAGVKLRMPPELTLTAGESQPLALEVERNNYDGALKLLHDGDADGIRLKLSPIAEGKTQVQITVTAESSARAGKHTLKLVALGTGNVRAEVELTLQIKPAAVLEKTFTNSIGMQLVLIPAGKFMMGSPAAEKERKEDEGPQHEVEITQPFYLGKYEVTQQEYERVLKSNPSYFGKDGTGSLIVQGLETRRFPVEMVSWDDAVKFCETLSDLPEEKANKRVYSLPTEAEWEYACRGGAPSYQIFHFDDKLSSREANFNGNFPYGDADKGDNLDRTTEVGQYKPNVFGLYDMHGNVWEWCQDRYDATYYQTCLDQKIRHNPPGPQVAQLNRRVMRGGSWSNLGRNCRSADRGKNAPTVQDSYVGFRVCVRTR